MTCNSKNSGLFVIKIFKSEKSLPIFFTKKIQSLTIKKNIAIKRKF